VSATTMATGSTHQGSLLQADEIADKLASPSRYL
jgi:hypothetical protein